MTTEPQTGKASKKGPVGPPLEQHKEWLVTEGNRIGELAKANPDWKSQIRVLQEAAQEETEPEVLLNLLRYQAARNKNWKEPRDVVTDLGALMAQCIEKTGDERRFAIELMQLLLLYTVRAYTYHNHVYREEQKKKGKKGGPR